MAALRSESAAQQATALEAQAQKLQKIHIEQMETLKTEAAQNAAAAAKKLEETEATAAKAGEQAAVKLSDLQAAFEDAKLQASSLTWVALVVSVRQYCWFPI